MRACRRALVVALLLACVAPSAALEWTPIARYGDPALGLPEGTLITSIIGPVGELDASRVALAAGTQPTFSIDALYRWTPEGGLALVASAGPDEIEMFVSDGAGAFAALFAGPEQEDACAPGETIRPHALRSEGAEGGFEVVAERGGPVPGAVAGASYVDLMERRCTGGRFGACWSSPLARNAAGDLAFVATIAPSPCAEPVRGLMAPDGVGGVELVALPGAPTPEPVAGTPIDWFSSAALDASGGLAFLASFGEESAIYRKDPGTAPELLARTGEPAGTAGGETWTALLSPSISSRGDVAFLGSTSPDARLRLTALRVVRPSGETVDLARAGEPVPGGPDGALFGAHGLRFGPPLALGAAGGVAFAWPFEVDDDSRAGIFEAGPDGIVTARVFSGDHAPGTGGATFGTSLDVHGLGDDGTLVFGADLVGGAVSDHALYLQKRGANPRLLLFSEPLSPPLSLGVDLDSPPGAIVARLQDGLYVASLPEPGATLAGLAALAALAMRRRRSAGE